MGLREIAAKLGIAYTSNKDAEVKLAKFITDKLKMAADIFVDVNFKRQAAKKLLFRDCVKEVWKSNNRVKLFYVDDPFLLEKFPELCGKEHPVEIGMGEESPTGELAGVEHNDDGSYKRMYIATGKLDKSKEMLEFNKNLLQIISIVYHECDHVYFKAQISDEVEGVERGILYRIDEAEVRAHSKQLAILFIYAYPNTPFNYKLLKKHIESNYAKEELPYNILSSLEFFRDPAKYEVIDPSKLEVKNKILGGESQITVNSLLIAFQKYMNYITYFVQFFNQHPEHKLNLEFDLR